MQDYPSIIPKVRKKDKEVLVLTDYYANTNSNYFHTETITSSGSEWIHTTRELLLCTTASIPLSSHVHICSNIHMLGKRRKVQIWKWSAKLQSQGPASPTGQNKEKLLDKYVFADGFFMEMKDNLMQYGISFSLFMPNTIIHNNKLITEVEHTNGLFFWTAASYACSKAWKQK